MCLPQPETRPTHWQALALQVPHPLQCLVVPLAGPAMPVVALPFADCFAQACNWRAFVYMSTNMLVGDLKRYTRRMQVCGVLEVG